VINDFQDGMQKSGLSQTAGKQKSG
jgi:hypothetical protein